MAERARQPWDPCRETLTEFGPLSSDVRPSGNFLTRLLKKGKNDAAATAGEGSGSSSSATGSQASSREASVERGLSLPGGPAAVPPQADQAAPRSLTPQPPLPPQPGSSRENTPDRDMEDSDGSTHSGAEAAPNSLSRRRMPKRTLSSVLNRLSNILDRSSAQTPQTYKDSDFKQFWMPDSSCRECYDCGDKFTTFRRRHHCRICGQIFCSKCCNQELPGKIIGYKGGIRVCTYCCKVVLRYAQQSETTGDMTVTKEDLRVLSPIEESASLHMGSIPDFGLWSPMVHKKMTSREDLSPQQSLLSPAAEGGQGGGSPVSVPFDLPSHSDFSGFESLDLERKILIQDSLQLREIWRQIQDPDDGVETQTHRVRLRTHQRCIVGRELVDWLLTHDKAAKREQAVAIGQALLFAGYLESVGTQPPVFKDDICIYKPGESSVQLPEGTKEPEQLSQNNEPLWFKEIANTSKNDSSFTTSDEGHLAVGESEAGSRRPFSSDSSPGLPSSSASSSSRPESGSSSSDIFKYQGPLRELLEEPLPRQDSSNTGLSDDILKGALQVDCSAPQTEALCPHSWRLADQLREENGERLAYQRLSKQHAEHQASLLQQLLSQAGLSQGWEGTVLTLMNQAARFVKPDVQIEADDMDIRKHIHIKKIPGGHRRDSKMYHGVVFTKNIAHKKMQEEVYNPTVLLLKGSIEYQRVENKFSSLEPQILQEREFLWNSVSKVAKLQPQILVVERSVSRLAQDFLLQMGITLLFNVKGAVMDRIARFTQADIVSSIDGLVSRPRLGVCHRFFCQTYMLPNGQPKTLAYFDGCATHLGCTIVLRHGTTGELKKVKEILRFMIYAAYNSLLEISFFMDEFAMPRPLPEEERALELDPFEQEPAGPPAPQPAPPAPPSSSPSTASSRPSTGTPSTADSRTDPDSADQQQQQQQQPAAALEVEQFELSLGEEGEGQGEGGRQQGEAEGSSGRVRFNISPHHQQEEEDQQQQGKGEGEGEGRRGRRGSDFDVVTLGEAAQIQALEISGSLRGVPGPLSRLRASPSPSPSPSPNLQEAGEGGEEEKQQQAGGRLTLPGGRAGGAGEEGKRCSTELTELTDQSDPLHTYQRHKDDSIFHSDITLQEQKQKRHRQFQRVLGELLLSVSPSHQLEPPFLESEAGALCELRRFLPDDLYWSPLLQPDSAAAGAAGAGGKKPQRSRFLELEPALPPPPLKYSGRPNIEVTEAHPLILSKLTAPLEDLAVKRMLADFRARGGRIRVLPVQGSKMAAPRDPSPRKELGRGEDTFPPAPPDSKGGSRGGLLYERKMDCLNPVNHQRLVVLFSSHSPKSPNHPNPCVYPWVVTMEYYGSNDISLAGFLHRFCFREAYQCPSESCDAPMLDHVRRFAHGKACISVLLRRLEHSIFTGSEACISTWSWCKKCKQVTAVVPLSADTANLSFAKYLQLRFHGASFQRRGSAQPCGHSLHHDHYQYFGYKTIVASFKYAEIQLREIALPPIIVSLLPQPPPDLARLREGVKQATNKGMDRFSNILENTMKLKNDVQGEAQNKQVSDFVAEQQKEKTRFRDFALQLQQDLAELSQESAPPPMCGPVVTQIQDSLVALKRMIGEAVNKWNGRIQDLLVQQQQQKKARLQSSKSSKDLREREQPPEEERPGRAVEERAAPDSSLPTASSSGGSTGGDGPPLPQPGESPQPDVQPSPDTRGSSTGGSVPAGGVVGLGGGTLSGTGSGVGGGTVNGAGSGVGGGTVSGTGGGVSGAGGGGAPVGGAGSVGGSSGPEDQTDSRASEKRSTRRNFIPSFLTGTSYVPVPLPYEASEHYLISPPCERVPVVIYDHENSSIIAYALSCSDYHQHLREIQGGNKETGGSSSALISRLGSRGCDLACAGSENYVLIEEVDSLPVSSSREEGDRSRSKPLSHHIELQFSDGVAKFYCRIYFAEQFRRLRKLIFPDGEDAFIRSLSRCKPWEAKGGKSGSSFCKTDDDRFILKQMSGMEVDSFEKFASFYFHHISTAYSQKKPTALAKILGVYRIGFRNNQTNHALRQDVLVVENLFYNRKITQTFDLKGSMRNRLVNTSGKKEEELVLMDENLLKLSSESPLYIRPHSKTVLRQAITNDSHFLAGKLVMDYSLLVGIDESRQELVVGIIDYIRTFTWDKKLEMVVKSTGRLVGQAKLPTVVSPELYRRRFLEAMDRYFLYVPDSWHGMGPDTPIQQNPGWTNADEEIMAMPKSS